MKMTNPGDEENTVIKEEGNESANTDRGRLVPVLGYLEDVKRVPREITQKLDSLAKRVKYAVENFGAEPYKGMKGSWGVEVWGGRHDGAG